MLIQRIVIQGFKTFAKRTEFVFDAGITAVVGPNGSGKSNIVDAIRWCLGEQSFSLLRSKKTSDVIFAGSDKRARLGMAQVSLTLDNSDGEIPIDFAEVEITRRAYRDGDNEYIVNGQRVRLADITELLAQTGLGKRTYAVVGQGLIDRVLSLAPEERRSLFEEAAGISGYQAKREAAIRRLDATEANLTRVRDIAAELAPRLGYLKRQADRAVERAQMAADLRGLLREWYGFKWHDALAALEDHRADALILRNALSARERELTVMAERVATLRNAQVDLRSALNDHHQQASALHDEAQRVSRDLAVARERQRQVVERREEMTRELAPLSVQQQTLRERIVATRAAVTHAEQQLAAESTQLVNLQASLDELRRHQRRHQSTLDDARRRQAAAQTSLTQHISRIGQLRERGQSLDETRARLGASAETSANEHTALQQRLGTAEAERTRQEAAIAALVQQIDAQSHQSEGLRKALGEAEQTRRMADREADKLQTRLDLLQRLSNEGAGMASGVRSVMQAHLEGILGPVAALLRVPANLDRPIEIALGGALQNLVASTWDDAQRAIEYLKQQQRGRATFMPLNRLNVSMPIRAPKMEGVLGNAADLVECDAHVAPVRDQLLNRVWIVSDMSTARRALDALRDGPRPTVVTLEGEIVRPGGTVTGGSDNNRGEDNSVLQRERDLRELPARVEAALQAAKLTVATCQRIAAEEAEVRRQREESQRAHGELVRQDRTQQSALAELRRSADRAEQQRAFADQQQRQVESETALLAKQVEALLSQQPAIEEQVNQLALQVATIEGEQSPEASEELLHQLADRRAAEAQAEGTLNSRKSTLTQSEHALNDTTQQIAARETRLAQFAVEGEALDLQLETLNTEESALTTSINALQAEIAPQSRQLTQLETDQSGAENEERAQQQLQRRDESAWSHAQLAQQRSEDALGQLQQEIMRDLGLVTVETSEEVALQQPLPFEAYVDELPVREALVDGLEEEVVALRTRLGRLVNVNPEAPREYEEASTRHAHLTTQSDDLEAAAADLHKIIRNLDDMMQSELARTFAAVAIEFQQEFRKLFNGGAGELVLTEPDNIAASGIDIIARPPGKRPQSLALLSGGERSLAACALIFAILRVSPTPFCVLDEVDAALDEANVDRFRMAVQDLGDLMQFIIVTHNRRTLEGASTIYGVTMGADGVSRVIGLRLEGEHMVHHRADANGTSPQEDEPTAAEIDEIVAL